MTTTSRQEFGRVVEEARNVDHGQHQAEGHEHSFKTHVDVTVGDSRFVTEHCTVCRFVRATTFRGGEVETQEVA